MGQVRKDILLLSILAELPDYSFPKYLYTLKEEEDVGPNEWELLG